MGNPDKAVTEVAKMMGEEWRKMTDKDKKPSQTQADKDKKRYEKEIAAYTKKYGEPPKKERKASTADKPKRKPNAYSMFIKDQASATMKSMGTTKVTEAMSELAKKWKGMTEKAKNKYVKQAAAAAAENE